MDEHSVRADFPVLERRIDGRPLAYLDSAATTLKPRSVVDAISAFYLGNGANIHRGAHYLSEEASNAYERARYRVAEFIGAHGNEIVFVKNTTEALNLVAQGLNLTRDDIVVGCVDSHHSQLLPWMRAASLELVRVGPDGRVDLDHFHQLLRLRPKVVALTHCSNVTGALAPVQTMAASAKHACNAIVVVDAAQSIPHIRIDVSTLGADFVAFSAHKMLGPTGVGCLYGRAEVLERLKPLTVGGGMVDWVAVHEARERKIPHRLEAGTPPIASVLGFGAAIDYLERLDPRWLDAHAHALTSAIVRGAAARDYLQLLGPCNTEARCPIGTLRITGLDNLSDVVRSLSDAHGIMVRAGHLCAQPVVQAYARGDVLRASAYIYTTEMEIDALFDALDVLVPLFVG